MLKKAAVCTDIHFGKKSNDKTHNEDCIRFLGWFKSQVQADPEIDHVMFLGDWNENRSALNIETLNYSYQGARILDSIGLPVYFIIGNHDLYRRHTREIHSVIPYQELGNFKLITEPEVRYEIGNGGALVCPYLFHKEYPQLKKYLNLDTWWGHFEFKGFIITGYSMTMPVGPDPLDYKGPKHIFSGHFHKRQAHEQVVYIGNTFPMDFGDAGDSDRGMMTYDHTNDETTFINWPDCPKYIKTTLNELLDKTVELQPEARVKCIVDVVISFEESTELRTMFMDRYNLREFTLEESREIKSALLNTETNVDWDNAKLKGVDELVVDMLKDIKTEHINNDLLVEIYQDLKE
jgi:DNA repair exonuclease SbcCD nuclease subunit